jgi:hypothetical protein
MEQVEPLIRLRQGYGATGPPSLILRRDKVRLRRLLCATGFRGEGVDERIGLAETQTSVSKGLVLNVLFNYPSVYANDS